MKKQSLLWEIKKPDNPKSYLFGTMHVKDNRAFEHVKRAQKALYKCSSFKTEINLDEAKNKINPSAYLLPNDQTISLLLGKKKFSKVQSTLSKRIGIDLHNYDRFLPLIIVNKLAEMVLNEDNHEALDAFLWTEASRMKLTCGGIETLNEQLNILRSLEVDIQIKMLKEVSRNIPKFKRSIEKLGDLYVNEDIAMLYKKTKKSLGSFRKIMLYQRNELMANRIAANLTESCFYAVGAAHLAGNKGIIAKLKKQGLKLKAI